MTLKTVTLTNKVNELVKELGSLRAVAITTGIDFDYLLLMLQGAKVTPNDELLTRLGLRRVVVYTEVEP